MTSNSPAAKKSWKTRYPLESFDPRFALLLKQAALKTAADPMVMVFNTSKEAFKFQQRIYQFRGRARDENHPDWRLFARATVVKVANILRIYAHDSDYDDVFKAAGVGEDPQRPQLAPGEDIMDDPDLAALFNRKDKS